MFSVGQKVMALWQSGKMYQPEWKAGKVIRVLNGRIVVYEVDVDEIGLKMYVEEGLRGK